MKRAARRERAPDLLDVENMTNTIRKISTLMMAGFVSGLFACSSTEIKTAQDPAIDLARYKTFAFMPTTQTEAANAASTQLDQAVQSELTKELVTRGLQEVPPSQAGLLVSYSGIGKNGMTYGNAPTPGVWSKDMAVSPNTEGSLTLQFIDGQSKRPVWQGTASDVIGESPKTPKVASAVEDILKNYPLKPVS